MEASSAQPSLFDHDEACAEADAARARMRETIDRLHSLIVPPWKDEMAVILDDGAFKRAMWSVPAQEGQALWTEYDLEMERLYAVFSKAGGPQAT